MVRKSRKDKVIEHSDRVQDSIPEKRPVPRPAAIAAIAVVMLFLGLTVGVVIDVVTKPVPDPAAPPPGTLKLKPAVPSPLTKAASQSSILDDKALSRSPQTPVRRFKPMALNAIPSDAPEDWPAVAIVIDDMGLDRNRGAQIVALPGPLTLSYLTYARDLIEQADTARAAGHEVMAHIPMEPEGNADPGPGVITTEATASEIRARMDAQLNSWSGYVGINNHMGSELTANRAAMDVVMAELQRRGLIWLDSRTGPNTVGEVAAAAIGVPYLGRDFFLDNEDDRAAITGQLQKVEALALTRGLAIAIGHPRDNTIQALQSWLPALEEKGIALIPITEAIRRSQR